MSCINVCDIVMSGYYKLKKFFFKGYCKTCCNPYLTKW